MKLSTVDQEVLDHLKGQQEPVTFQDLLDATGFRVVALGLSALRLERAGLITSGEGEFPFYQLAQPKPVVPLGYAPPCTSCVRCGECAPDEHDEASIYY